MNVMMRDRVNQLASGIRQKALDTSVVGCPGKPAARVELGIREAQLADASIVKAWFGEREFEWLGGASCGGLPAAPEEIESAIVRWIEDALSAFVLMAKGEPVAFMVVEHNPNEGPELGEEGALPGMPRLELGRLIVRPGNHYRQQGYATTLLMHVYRAYLEYAGDDRLRAGHMVLRTAHDNKVCREFLRKLPLRLVRSSTDPLYRWYAPPNIFMYQQDEIGKRIKELRDDRGLTQSRLAYLVGMDSSKLAMIETGSRPLKFKDASRLLSVLMSDPIEEMAMACHLLGFDFRRAAWRYNESLLAEISKPQSLWIFSDRLAEQDRRAEQDGRNALEQSAAAIKDRYKRFYFIPSTFSDKDLAKICAYFRDALLYSGKVSLDELRDRVRFYSAPRLLCSLRLVVHNPEPDVHNADKLTVADGSDSRWRMEVSGKSTKMTKDFVERVSDILRDIEEEGGQVDGFAKIDCWKGIES